MLVYRVRCLMVRGFFSKAHLLRAIFPGPIFSVAYFPAPIRPRPINPVFISPGPNFRCAFALKSNKLVYHQKKSFSFYILQQTFSKFLRAIHLLVILANVVNASKQFT